MAERKHLPAVDGPAPQTTMVFLRSIDQDSHPLFVLRDNENLKPLKEKIKDDGVKEPILLRPEENGRFLLLDGQRRLQVCKELELSHIPAVICCLSENETSLILLQRQGKRQGCLPTEKATLYVRALTGLRSFQKTDREGTIINPEEARILSEISGVKEKFLQRYLRLNDLLPELRESVDQGELGLRAAESISYLTINEQREVWYATKSRLRFPDAQQGIEMRERSRKGTLSPGQIHRILVPEPEEEMESISVSYAEARPYLMGMTNRLEIREFIIKALKYYADRHAREPHEGKDREEDYPDFL